MVKIRDMKIKDLRSYIKKYNLTVEGDKRLKTNLKRAVIKKNQELKLKKNINKLNKGINEVQINFEEYKSLSIEKIIDIIFSLGNDVHDRYRLLEMGNTTYTISPKFKENILNNLILGEKNAIATSDNIVIQEIRNFETVTIKNYRPPIRNIRLYKKRRGAFFKYISLIDNVDLSDLQIYNKKQFDEVINTIDFNEYCLLYSLKKLGMSEIKINQLKTFVKDSEIPQSDLIEICNKLKIRINLRTDYKDKVFNYGKEHEETYNINLLDGHYFIDTIINVTSYYLENYETLKEKENANMIYNKRNDKDEKRFINSYKVVKILLENKGKLIRDITINDNIDKTIFYNKVDNIKFDNLNYDEDINTKENKIEDIVKKWKKLNEEKDKFETVYFDFEAITKNVENHLPYLVVKLEEKSDKTKTFFDFNCGYNLLMSLNKDTRLIAHNCEYDSSFLIPYLSNITEVTNTTSFMQIEARFYNYKLKKSIKIILKDSYRLITSPLRDFPEMFFDKDEQKKYKKEVIPYSLYTIENIEKNYVSIDEAVECLKQEGKEKYINDFLDNINNWNLRINNNFDLISYSEIYCKMDCFILKKGYMVFRDWCKKYLEGLNIDHIISSASLAHQYFLLKGCYENVFSLSGIPRMFIQSSLVGGRTMTNNNIKQCFKKVFNRYMSDLDATSLYPSAIIRLKGYLQGKPKVLKSFDKDVKTWNKYDDFFIEIKIKNVGINRSFSLLSKKIKGVRKFNNEMIDEIIVVNKTTLEDLIEFQKIDYEFIKGYYFDEGFNNKCIETIKYLFDKRAELKKQENPAEQIFKLIMNSAYGKTIMKEQEYKFNYVSADRFDAHLQKEYTNIITFTIIKNDLNPKYDIYRVKERLTINEHFSIPQVGTNILSMSKRIMNEVMCLAEDNNIKIYYQDTDSMHLEKNDISKLQKLFFEKYDRELIGKKLGQFKPDFKISPKFEEQNPKFEVKNIEAIESIFLGKKCYIDVLEVEDVTGFKKIDYHIRMKGISNESIYTYCEQNNMTPLQLYEKLNEGQEIEFDLTCNGKKALFKKTSDKKYTMNPVNRRLIKFLGEGESN